MAQDGQKVAPLITGVVVPAPGIDPAPQARCGVHVMFSDDLWAELERWRGRQPIPPARNRVIVQAVQEFLQRQAGRP